MYKINKIIFGALLILLSFQSYSQTKNFIDKPYIETTAIVDTLVVPDRIYLSILITEKDTKGRTSVGELENKMNSQLKALGIDTEKQLTLSDLASNFKKYFLRKTDIQKRKAYSLLVYDAKTAGKVIISLESIGISNVNLEKTKYSKIEDLKIELKQKAIVKAKRQAESMLKPLNQKLGNAIFISDLNSNITNMLQGRVSGVRIRGYASISKNENAPIDIEFEKIKIKSEVNVKFGIE